MTSKTCNVANIEMVACYELVLALIGSSTVRWGLSANVGSEQLFWPV